jgi:hypothetical protein
LNFIVEPYIRFKFKKLRLETIKQYKQMNKLSASQAKNKLGARKGDSDSSSGLDGGHSDDLDNDEFQACVKKKLQEIKVLLNFIIKFCRKCSKP